MEITEMFLESDNEIIIKLIDTFGDSQLYVPQMKIIVRKCRNRSIYKDFL